MLIFGGSCFSSTFPAFVITGFLFCCLSYVFFSKIKLFVLGLSSTFWCFVLLCSDLKVVFKRTIYPNLSWC